MTRGRRGQLHQSDRAIGIAGIVLFGLVLHGNAQAPPKPKPIAPPATRPAPAPRPAGTLLITVDAASRVSVDGEDMGVFEPDRPRRIPIDLGQHLVAARSTSDTSVSTQTVVEVKGAAQVVVGLQLADKVSAGGRERQTAEAAARDAANREAEAAERQARDADAVARAAQEARDKEASDAAAARDLRPPVTTLSWPRESPPRPLPGRSVKFPAYEVRTLENGMQVLVVPHHEQPAVNMRLLMRAGSADDPPGKKGLAALLGALLDQGTATRNAQDTADFIDSIGGGLSVGAGSELMNVNVVVMKDSFDVGMELLADVARKPAFAEQEIERQREQALAALQVNAQSPDFLADAVINRLIYGFHPYGLPPAGTLESLGTITRADLVAFHQTYFAPNNAILAIVGDVTGAEAFAGAERVFGAWARHEVPTPRTEKPPDPTRRIVVVNVPNAVQTEVRVGHIGIARKHPDYMAVNLALKILGGEGSNRLHRVLRTERGLTYGASAEMETLRQAGAFMAETNTRSDATAEVLRLIVDEYWTLMRERVGDRELEDAQAYLTGSFPLTIETPDDIATQVLNAVFYELPLSELENYRERVNAVSPDDIQRVARLYLKPDRLSMVLVGDASTFIRTLQNLGFDKFELIDATELDLTRPDLRKPRVGAVHPGPFPLAGDPPKRPSE